MVVGLPEEDRDGTNDAGQVQILYGSASGLTDSGDELWTQGSAGIPGGNQSNDGFGSALAVGYFDGDTFADVAIGIPGEDIDGKNKTGRVLILRGSASGLTTSGNQTWQQATSGIPGSNENDDEFGAALVAGHFNDDAFEDLAIGVPGEGIDGEAHVGRVAVLYGTEDGLSSTGVGDWQQDSSGIGQWNEDHDRFGLILAAGDFDHDGRDDLAVGVPREGVSNDVLEHKAWLKSDPDVADLRDLWGADLVGLTVENMDDWCGFADVLTNSNGSASSAFQVTQRSCLAHTYAHEHGHNMGMTHNPSDAGSGLYDFSFGHHFSVVSPPLGSFRTVMSYNACNSGSCTRLPYFSNPDVYFFEPTGIEGERDNARTGICSGPLIEGYR